MWNALTPTEVCFWKIPPPSAIVGDCCVITTDGLWVKLLDRNHNWNQRVLLDGTTNLYFFLFSPIMLSVDHVHTVSQIFSDKCYHSHESQPCSFNWFQINILPEPGPYAGSGNLRLAIKITIYFKEKIMDGECYPLPIIIFHKKRCANALYPKASSEGFSKHPKLLKSDK